MLQSRLDYYILLFCRYLLLKYELNWMRKTSATKEDIISLQTELYMTCLQDSFKTEVILKY